MRRSGTPREIVTLSNDRGERYTMKRERLPEASYGRHFMTIFPDAVMRLASVKLPRAVCPVMIWCWSNLDHRDFRVITQANIADEIGTTQASVSEALAILLQQGFIERVGAGPRQMWKLTPETSWKGTAGAYQKARRERGRAFTVVDGGAE